MGLSGSNTGILLHLKEAVKIHTEATGSRPLGWYTGRCSMNTVDLVTEEGGFLYISDSYLMFCTEKVRRVSLK